MTSPPIPLVHGRPVDLAAAAAARIEPRLGGSLREDARVGILVPSRAFGDTILAALLERRPALSGLRVHTIDSLSRAILNDAAEFPSISDDTMQRLAMSTAVRETGELPFDAPALPALVHRSWRDARDSGLSLDELGARARSVKLAHPDRFGAALDVWKRREDAMRRTETRDAADIVEAAVAKIETGIEIPAQVLAGFYDVTGLQRKFIEALATAGKIDAIFLPIELDGTTPAAPWRFAEPFARRAIEIADTTEAAEDTGKRPDVHIRRFRDRTTEIRETIRSIRALLDAGTPPAKIAIAARVVPPSLASLVGRIAKSFDVAVSGAGSRPFRAHRIPRAVVQLLRLRERRWARGDIVEILNAGFDPGNGWLRARDVVEIDRTTRHHFIAGGTAEEIRAILPRIEDERADDAKTIERYASAVEALEKRLALVAAPMRGAAWSTWLTTIVDAFRLDDENDLAATERLDSIADTLRRCDDLGAAIEIEDVVALVQNAADLPAPASSGTPVWIGDVMQLRGRVFDHLFVVAVEDGVFPQQRTPDPILDDDDRRALGLHEIGDGLDEERLLLELAIFSATTTATLSFASADIDRRPARPSSLLAELAVRLDPASELEILGNFTTWVDAHAPEQAAVRSPNEALRDAILRGDEDASIPPGVVRALRVARATGTRSPWDGWLHPDDALRDLLRRRLGHISPTHLEDFGVCPQRFLFKRIFHVREIEDPDHEIEMERRRRGSVVHRILEKFYATVSEPEIRGSSARRELAEPIRARLDEIITRAFEEDSVGHPPFNAVIRGIEHANLRSAIVRFVANDMADLDSEQLVPRGFEMHFGDWGEEVQSERRTIELGGIEMGIRGSIDRVDRGANGRVRVVDYKSGTASHLHKLADKIDEGTALQVPLYALVATEIFDVSDEMVTGLVKPLRPSHPIHEYGFNLGEKRQALEHVLGTFVGRIVDGVFPAWPGNERACDLCPVGDSCRTRHDPELRYIALLSKTVLDLIADPEERNA